jgi:RNA polymerase sigma factor (sigma-70 family)
VGSATLAERVLSGDQKVIHELVESCWPAMRYPVLGGLVDAAELRQAARAELVEAARAYDQLRDGDFATHATRRIRRLVERVRRRERRLRERLIPLDELPEQLEPRAPEPPPASPGNPRLRRALDRLSPRLRSVIIRLYYREVSALDVAAQDGTSPAAVERARRRALARMKRDLRGPRTMPPC